MRETRKRKIGNAIGQLCVSHINNATATILWALTPDWTLFADTFKKYVCVCDALRAAAVIVNIDQCSTLKCSVYYQ